MPSEYIQNLIDNCGTRPLSEEERKRVEAFERAVREKVTPAVLKERQRQAILAHNARLRSIPLPEGD